MTIGQKIKQLRESQNKTLEMVGKSVGVSTATVSKWESGIIKDIRSDNLFSLASAFGVSMLELVSGTEYDKPAYTLFCSPDGIPVKDIFASEGIAARMVKPQPSLSSDKPTLRALIDALSDYEKQLPSALSPDELRLLDSYRHMTAKQQAKARKILEDLSEF